MKALSTVIVGLAFPALASATTYFVSKSGNNANTCEQARSVGSAKLTIGAGLSCLAAGDTLEIKQGTYKEAIFNNANDKFPDGLDAGRLTTIRGAAGEVVVWTASGDHILLLKNCGSYTRYENLRFDGSLQSSGDAWKHFRQDGKTTVGLVFNNNQVYDAPNNGVFNSVSTSGWLISNNTVHDSGRGTDPAGDKLANNMYLEGDNHIIRGNRVFYTPGTPTYAFLESNQVRAGNIRLASNAADPKSSNNNIIENNYVSGGTVGIVFGAGANNLVRNNIAEGFVPTWGIGIMLWSQNAAIWPHDNNRIYNNTVMGAASCIQAYTSPEVTNSKAKNNILYNCAKPIDEPRTVFEASNNFTSDPLFVDATKGDVHLSSTSLAIDKGLQLDDVQLDFAGNARGAGEGWDIGAFEFASATPPKLSPITVDSTFPGYDIVAIDDDVIDAKGGTDTTWASTDSASEPHWVSIDFGTARELSFVTVHWAFNSFRQELMTSQQVDVQYFDGKSFVTLGSLSDADGLVSTSRLDFAPVSTTKLRLWQPANMGPQQYSGVMWLTEVDYGKEIAGCDDADGDTFTDAACGGVDCDDTNDNIHPSGSEVCDDGVDNDCDGDIDAADTQCQEEMICPDNYIVVSSGGVYPDEFTVIVNDANGAPVTCARITGDLQAMGCRGSDPSMSFALLLLLSGLFVRRRRSPGYSHD
ncbi:MAG: putative metal-binding motif-containing protein [Myxococcota bacterium]